MTTADGIRFVRLTTVPVADVAALLGEPRNARHLPLAGRMDAAEVARWVAAKDAQWEAHGYGPEAILVDGVLAGWGGFQRETWGADLALVLAPAHWGRGAEIAALLLRRGFAELRLDAVTIALPHSRHPEGAVARWGFAPDGEETVEGVPFHRYRLPRERWESGCRLRDARPPGPEYPGHEQLHDRG